MAEKAGKFNCLGVPFKPVFESEVWETVIAITEVFLRYYNGNSTASSSTIAVLLMAFNEKSVSCVGLQRSFKHFNSRSLYRLIDKGALELCHGEKPSYKLDDAFIKVVKAIIN